MIWALAGALAVPVVIVITAWLIVVDWLKGN